MSEINNTNETQWITMNGNHIPIKPGQSKDDAIDEFISKKPKKYFMVKNTSFYGTSKFLVSEDNIEKYRNNGSYRIEDIDISQEIAAVNEMNLDLSYKTLRKQVREIMLNSEVRGELMNILNDRIAEHQTALADEYLKGVPKHKDISVEESLLEINKNHYDFSKSQPYDSPERAAYTYNCQRCAQAFVLRYCHGYDVEARPSECVWNAKKRKFDHVGADERLDSYSVNNEYHVDKDGMDTGWNGWEAVIFNRQDVMKTKMRAYDIAVEGNDDYISADHQRRQINKIVKKAGDGSVFLCSVAWKGTRKSTGEYSGHVFCVLNDNGKIKYYDPQTGEECSKYFTEKQIVPRETEIFRADNCRLNGSVMGEVVTYEKPI